MRVLLISHTCQSITEGQPKAALLAALPGVELMVLVPDRWMHYGSWRSAEKPSQASFDFRSGKVLWPWSGPGQWYLHFYPGLARLLREFRPDVIDLWEEPWGLVSAHTCFLRNRLLPGAKIISETEQNIDKRLPPPFESFRKYTLRNADYVVARSGEALDILRRKGYSGPGEVVPNAVDAQLFQPMDRANCRAQLGWPIGEFVAGYVGRLVEEKGLMDIVEALPLCPEVARVVMVGSGPMKDALEERTRQLRQTERLTLLDGRPLEELPAIMNALDVLLLPSRTTARWKEQFGRVIIEAQACKVPVIGSNSGAIPEVVGGGGLCVPESDPAALAGAMRTLQSDPGLRASMGEVGYTRVHDEFTWARVAARMHTVYKKLTPAESGVSSAPSD